jgi:hypothetical protein
MGVRAGPLLEASGWLLGGGAAPLALGVLAVGVLAMGVLFGAAFLHWFLVVRPRRPSAHRNWATDHAEASEFIPHENGRWTIRHVRRFTWTGPTSGTPRWEDWELDLSTLTRVWLAVTPFRERWRGFAHTFVSFEFADGRFLALSVEARREVGERYGFVKGIQRTFEILYVAADEADLIHLRALHRRDEVHLYPLALDPAQGRALFESFARGANTLRDAPCFYHTTRDNCTTRILDHLEPVLGRRIPRGFETFFPGHMDALFLREGLLAVTGSLAEVRAASRMNGHAEAHAGSTSISRAIRARP